MLRPRSGAALWRAATFKLEMTVFRFGYRLVGWQPSSRPFLSGDGYRALAHHRFEAGAENRFRPERVKKGDLVFCEAWKLAEFFQGPAREIREPFVLLSSNGDPNVTSAVSAARPPLAVRWFAQNLATDDATIEALPIGLENRNRHCNGIPADFRRLRIKSPGRKNRVLYGFAVSTNPPEREAALAVLESSPWAEALPFRVNAREYRRLLSGYCFVASPEGNGLDCHRTWEALYLGVVPIVRRSVATERFLALGLPLLLVDEWSDLASWSEEFLFSRYQELKTKFNHPALWMDYWREAFSTASTQA